MKIHSTRILFYLLFIFSGAINAQFQIEGKLTNQTNQKIQLLGFEGVQAYIIDETEIDTHGNFTLNFSEADYGMGYLTSKNNASQILVLAKENTAIVGQSLDERESLAFTKGTENIQFWEFTKTFPINQNALGAWEYLAATYQNNPHLQNQSETRAQIQAAIEELKKMDQDKLKALPNDSYIKWFIPIQQIIGEINYVVQNDPASIPLYVNALREIDHEDERFYKSGLFKDALEGHFVMLEQISSNRNEVEAEMKKSIDILVDQLVFDDQKINEFGQLLFQFFENRNQVEISEYLAVKLLNESNCSLYDSLEKQLEVYRKMKPGNTAAEIAFEGDVFYAGKRIELKNLNEIDAEYYLLAFGSSWCPACVEELPKLQKEYGNFQNKDVEVVLISLDTSFNQFKNFVRDFSFYAASDYKKWDTKAVADYHVFSTPTLYLIDKNRKILHRPRSVEDATNWISTQL